MGTIGIVTPRVVTSQTVSGSWANTFRTRKIALLTFLCGFIGVVTFWACVITMSMEEVIAFDTGCTGLGVNLAAGSTSIVAISTF